MEENLNNISQNTEAAPAKPFSKSNQLLDNLKLKLGPKLTSVDTKFATFMPNPKLRKVAYIATGSLFGFMFLIIFLGLLLSPMRNSNNQTGTLFKKPVIVSESPKPQVELSEKQKEILKFQTEINNLRFPESQLTPPLIESNLSI